MVMTEIPFNLKGRVFRSAMPFGAYDLEGEVLGEYFENNISVVVPLAGVEECIEKAGRDLYRLYQEKGFEVVPLPVEDLAAPRREAMADVIGKVIRLAGSGRNVVVHCSAGQGRTGTFMACMARELLGLSGDEAIAWARTYIPGAVETPQQANLVYEYIPTRKSS